MYDYVIVTHLPCFYKVNLYNELAKNIKIFVIFISNNTDEKRSGDFIDLSDINFEYNIINKGDFQSRNQLKSILSLRNSLKNLKYKKLLVSGWDLIEFWYLVLKGKKRKLCLALESTILESNTNGIKGIIKKIFLSRISTVFASGDLHVKLLEKLSYTGNIKVTQGVGIINKPEFVSSKKEYQKRFLFIGRLSKVKNLEMLINIFNELKEYQLTILGVGEEGQYLRSISNKNILFKGSVENKEIKNIFFENDIFILPSISETWGLVVEEALYFGLPVIISENCGARELIQNEKNGFIINPKDEINIRKTILKINSKSYVKMIENVNEFNLDKKDKKQIEVYSK